MIGNTYIVSIAAVAENGVIGTQNGNLPWDGYEKDISHFERTIQGAPLLMGRRTATQGGSFRRFNQQPHLVLTSNPERNKTQGFDFVGSVSEAKSAVRELESDVVYNVGGGEVYREFFEDTDQLIISHLHDEYDGSVYFPEIRASEWYVLYVERWNEFTIKYFKRRNQNY